MGQVLELLCLQPPIPNIIHSDRTLTHETGMMCERLSPLQDTTCRHMTWDGPQHHTKRLPWPSLPVVSRTSILWWGLMCCHCEHPETLLSVSLSKLQPSNSSLQFSNVTSMHHEIRWSSDPGGDLPLGSTGLP
jgi:hypothetical protein